MGDIIILSQLVNRCMATFLRMMLMLRHTVVMMMLAIANCVNRIAAF